MKTAAAVCLVVLASLAALAFADAASGEDRPETFTIVFEENGGSEVPDVSAAEGEPVIRPPDPEKPGYAFAGWYLSKSFTNGVVWDGLVMPNGGAVFFARWYMIRGIAGDSSDWEYFGESKKLVITGTGKTYDYELGGAYGLPPWRMLDVDSAVYGEGITDIGKNAFSGLGSLTSVTLPSTLKSLGDGAFSHTSVCSVSLPNGLEEIGNHVFNGDPISSICLPPSLMSIGEGAFQSTSLSVLDVPDKVESIGANAFSGIETLSSLTFSEGLVSVGAGAFFNTSITSVILPDSLKAIGFGAFGHCGMLRTATTGDGVSLIPTGLFNGCGALESVTFGSGVKAMDRSVFIDCPSLKTVIIPVNMSYFATGLDYTTTPFSGSAVENILVDPGNRYYESVDGVLFTTGLNELVVYPPGRVSETYVVPDNVYGIGDFAFRDNRFVKNVILSEMILSIGKMSLHLDNIVLPDSVVNIEEKAFCTSNITFGKGVTVLKGEYFEKSPLVINLGIGAAVIDKDVSLLKDLHEINVDPENLQLKSINGIVYTKNLNEVVFIPPAVDGVYVMPNSVTYLRGEIFSHNSISTVILSENLKAIGAAAFKGNVCIKEIKIPASVSTIGSSAFEGCKNLRMVYFEGTIPPNMGYHSFYLGSVHDRVELRVHSTFTEGFMERYVGKFTSVEYLNADDRPSVLEEISGNLAYVFGGILAISVGLVVSERVISKRKG